MSERSGEHTARDRLSLQHYGRYRSELIAFIRSRFGAGPPDPEDVVQQAFVNFAALDSPGRIANPRAFLYRSAYNIVLNQRKHERIGRQFLEPSSHADDVSNARDDLNPEVVISSKEQYSLLEAVIRAMPAKRREYLLLNRIEGLSYAEIARRAGLSESVIRKHVALAVRECGAVLLQATEPAQKQGGQR